MTLARTIRDYTPESVRMLKRRLMRRSDGEKLLRQRYREVHGGELDLADCKTFTQKLYRRMIETNRDGNPTFARLSDKYLARSEVVKTVGEQYLIPLIGTATTPAQFRSTNFRRSRSR